MKPIYSFVKTVFFFILFIFAASGCNDENNFGGTDNYITSFALEKDGTQYVAAIKGDSIIMTKPANISLEKAVPKITLSENALISPQPESISNWDEKRSFTVRSYSKTERTYIYAVKEQGIISEGDIVLLSKEELDAFADTGITEIAGNLIIGKETGETAEDSILSLVPLAGINAVAGDITIHPTYAGVDIEGLGNITRANSLNILKSKTIEKIVFPNLSVLGENMNITCEKVEEVSFPQLAGLGGSVTISSSQVANSVRMPLLETVGANVTFSGMIRTLELPELSVVTQVLSFNSLPALEELYLPALSRAQTININSLPTMREISIDKLESCSGNFTINNMGSLETISIPSLSDVEGTFSLQGLAKLTQINAGKLKIVNVDFNLSALPSLTDLTAFSSVTTIGRNATLSNLGVTDFKGLEALETIENGSLQITYNLSLTSLAGFNALRSIGQDLQIYGSSSLTVLDGFPVLQSVNNVNIGQLTALTDISKIFASLTAVNTISINYCDVLSNLQFHEQLKKTTIPQLALSYLDAITLDLEGMKIDAVQLQFIDAKVTLKGSDYFDGNISLIMVNELDIDGIKEVKNFTIGVYGTSSLVLNIPSIRKVRENFQYEMGYGSSVPVSFPDMEEIGGIFTLNGYASPQAIHPQFPKLKKTGTFNYGGGPLKKLEFPILETVEKDMVISTFWQSDCQIEEIDMPSLKKIGGMLSILSTSTSPNQFNDQLTDLDGLGSLTQVGGVNIIRQKSLTSFKGLENSIASLPADRWTVSDNAYNPTYQDMLDGKYVQP
ncbi:hypothetical protein [uncultured Proteiniphilum sp.]|uniref:hypothetical protein n=1 Tax=uncultured Proteiniphilum sp. TaxID=497637 RepID=UPI00260FBF7F|nr:hypothetical protein [uncultured Proteiniphilum sp.]